MQTLEAFKKRPIAHRGFHNAASGIIENSLGAMEKAVERGFGIEIDIQATRDGQAIVFHDADLKRLTGHEGLVADNDAADLVNMQLAGKEIIPSLATLLTQLAGRVPLLIEIKSSPIATSGFLEHVARLVSSYSGPVAFFSFDLHLMQDMLRLTPSLPLGVIFDDFKNAPNLQLLKQQGFQFLAANVQNLTHDYWQTARNMKAFDLFTWTVRSAEQAHFARQHADQIIFEGFDPEH